MNLGITRKKAGRGFSYELGGKTLTDQATKTRIKSLAIPPAWTDVQISVSDGSKIQAKGRDKKNRLQYIYHPAYQAQQANKKFERITEFAKLLPKLRRQIYKDLSRRRYDKRKVVACAVSLLDETYLRIGNENYAEENQSYGLTTLRSKHVSIEGNKVILDFKGKSGQLQHKEVKDTQLSRLIKKLDDMPGYELFRYYDENGYLNNLRSSDVNDYIKAIIGEEFSAKDFRTWGGTLKAYVELAYIKQPKTKAECKKAISVCIRRVAKKLGNTPAIARGSYIDPRLLHIFEKQNGFEEVSSAFGKIKNSKYLNHEEQAALQVLTVGIN